MAPVRPRTGAWIAAVLALIMSAACGGARGLEWRGSEECEAEALDWYNARTRTRGRSPARVAFTRSLRPRALGRPPDHPRHSPRPSAGDRRYVSLMGYERWNATVNRPAGALKLRNLTSGFDRLGDYMGAVRALGETHNPVVGAVLPYARSFSLFDHMAELPASANEAGDVAFELPDASAVEYAGVSDLLFMPIRKMAALIKARRVSCTEVVSFFIERTRELDALLALVTVPLYGPAMEMAAALDAELAEGSYRGPLMCIPFGLKDHYMVHNETTTYGHLLYYHNYHSRPATLTSRLMDVGAVPIAKATLGAFAISGSVTGWGVCLSPYLNGHGSGSSCGSGAGAAAGAFPFALSEETGGSIAGPSAASLISGYLSRYARVRCGGRGDSLTTHSLCVSLTTHSVSHSGYLPEQLRRSQPRGRRPAVDGV